MNKVLHQNEQYIIFDLTSDKYPAGYTIIDASDFDLVSQYNWHIAESRGRLTVVTKQKTEFGRTTLQLSRLVMNCPDDMLVDHKNRNTLINAKFNLRVCTHSQNSANQVSFNQSIDLYKGVEKLGNRFKAKTSFQGKKIYIGLYETAEQAATAYNNTVKILFGEFAKLNVIKEVLV